MSSWRCPSTQLFDYRKPNKTPGRRHLRPLEGAHDMLLLVLCLATACYAQVQTVGGKINLQVGVTSACPDAYNFINALAPVYEKYGQFLDVEFVPWGRTRRVGDALQCQFGANDCWANRVHRCVLERLPSQAAAMAYMLCEFTRPLPAHSGSYSCVLAAGLRLVDVHVCASTGGDALDAAAEAKAAGPMWAVNFVPYIVVNGVSQRALSEAVRRSPEKIICDALSEDPATGVAPEQCPPN